MSAGATNRSPFTADLTTAINATIHRHRNTSEFTDTDRELAVAIGKVLDPEAGRGNGINAVINRAIRGASTPTQALDLGEFFRDLPIISERVDHFEQSSGLDLGDSVHVEPAALGSSGHDVNETPAAGHSLRDIQATNVRSSRRVGHSHTPSLHGFAARYVAGAIVAASRQVQRRAWVRRAADLGSRPSDTTGSPR